MYEAFYGLTERPFNLTPDPRFLYLSKKHEEALAHLLYGIRNRTGFILVSGEVGAGKTTVCRSLIGKLDPGTELALVFNPWLSAIELLKKINEEFGIKSEADTIKGLIDELNHYLLDCFHQDKNCVLIIDEAQDLEPATLEQIRLLSNLETDTQKLLQIVLLGQPELVESLAREDLRQLNQRITARYHLGALNYDEMVEYIASRLRVAGGRRKLTFQPQALKALFRASGGIPRMVNALCDRALLIGYTHETRDITLDIVHQAEREVRGEPPRKKNRAETPLESIPPWVKRAPAYVGRAIAAGLLIAVVFGVAGFGLEGLGKLSDWVAAVSRNQSTPDGTQPKPRVEPGDAAKPDSLPGLAMQNHTPSPLAAFIDKQGPDLLRNSGSVVMLRAWNAPMSTGYPERGGAQALQAFFEANGLDAQILSAPLEKAAALGLPMLVKLLGERETAWTALLRTNDDEAVLVAGLDREASFPMDKVTRRYLGQAVIPWRDPTPNAPILRQGSAGDRVRRVQQRLMDLGYLAQPPDGRYDAETAAAVRVLQADLGLEVDGIVGSQTRMPLFAALPIEEDAPAAAQSGAPTSLAANPKPSETAPQPDTSAEPESDPESDPEPPPPPEPESPKTSAPPRTKEEPEAATEPDAETATGPVGRLNPPADGVEAGGGLAPAPAEEVELAPAALAGAPLVPRAPEESTPPENQEVAGQHGGEDAEESP